MFTAITVVMIAAVIALNLILTHFGLYNTVFLDMTPEGLYTLSDAMVEECDEIFETMRESDPAAPVAR